MCQKALLPEGGAGHTQHSNHSKMVRTNSNYLVGVSLCVERTRIDKMGRNRQQLKIPFLAIIPACATCIVQWPLIEVNLEEEENNLI